MGTNYYIKFKERKVKQQDLHIGKSSSGSEFLFHGYENDSYYKIPQLKSKQEWFEYIFLYMSDMIYSEDNKQISFLDFADIVNKSINENTKSHYEYLVENNESEALEDCFIDTDGFSFDMLDFE